MNVLSLLYYLIDYAPEWPLSEICYQAGISGASFPIKTTLWINFENCTVKYNTIHGPSGLIYPTLN